MSAHGSGEQTSAPAKRDDDLTFGLAEFLYNHREYLEATVPLPPIPVRQPGEGDAPC